MKIQGVEVVIFDLQHLLLKAAMAKKFGEAPWDQRQWRGLEAPPPYCYICPCKWMLN